MCDSSVLWFKDNEQGLNQAAKITRLLYHFFAKYRRYFKCYYFVAKQKICREVILLNLGIAFLTLKVYIIVKLKKLGGFAKNEEKLYSAASSNYVFILFLQQTI